MIQTYRIFWADPTKPPMSYCGLVFSDGESAESRTDDELSLRKPPNASFREAVMEHGRGAFDWEITGNYDYLLDALKAEADQIEEFRSWHSDHGWNKTRGIDKKRLARANEEYVEPVSQESQFEAGFADFKNNHIEAYGPYDSLENKALLYATAVKEKCSVTTAFMIALEAGTLIPKETA